MSVDVHLSYAPHIGEWTITRSDQPSMPPLTVSSQGKGQAKGQGKTSQQDTELPGPSPKDPELPPKLSLPATAGAHKKPSQLPPDLVDPTEPLVQKATEMLQAMKRL